MPPKAGSSLAVPKASKPAKQFNVSSFHSMFAQPSAPAKAPDAQSSASRAVASGSGSGVGKVAAGKGKVVAKVEPFPVERVVRHEQEEANRSQELWVHQFEPRVREDLAIHARKLVDLQNWLNEALLNKNLSKYRRLLVISGPAGSGKTAALKMLAREMGVEVNEWKNGSNHSYEGDVGSESMVQQFTTFLYRAGMTAALEFGPDPTSSTTLPSISLAPPSPLSLASTSTSPRLILLEDLPNTSHYPTKLALRSALLQFLGSPRSTAPLVLIVSEAFSRPGVGQESESTGGDGAGFGENVDARNVCGIEVLQHPATREISFNAIAVTIMKKALVKTLDTIYTATPSPYHITLPPQQRPSVQTLEIIIANSNGDIRSALMSLEFLAANPGKGSGAMGIGGGVVSKAKGKKRKADEERDLGQGAKVRELLQFVSARESSLFIFHALGKVLYSKRWGDDEVADKKDLNRYGIEPEKESDRLPRHLKQFRRKPSKVNPDVLFAEAPVDSDVFLSYLHHNFPAFVEEVEESWNVLEGMSVADALMRMDGDDFAKRVPLTSNYSHAIAVRTTMLSLPSPVPRTSHKMRKSPMWENARLAREREEGLEELGNSRSALGRGGLLGGLVGGGLGANGGGLGGGEESGSGGLRSKRVMGGEVIGWLGLIKGKALKASNPFLYEIATFPPAPGEENFSNSKRDLALAGEPLGEKDTTGGDTQEDGEEEEGAAGKSKEEGEEGVEFEKSGELLYLEEDDIED